MSGRLAALSVLLGGLDVGISTTTQHELLRKEDEVRTFDDKVLGNLANAMELANLEVPRSHLFTARIDVGTPAQTMSCLLDSGSADIWVPSKRCQNCDEEHHFAADRSTSFMPAVVRTDRGLMPVPVRASFSDGDILGFLVQDAVNVAGTAFKNQSLIIVEDEAMSQDRSWDGVCGLGFRQLSDAGQPLYRNMPPGQPPYFSLIPSNSGGHLTTFLSIGDLPMFNILPETLGWASAEPLVKDDKLSFWVVSGGLKSNSIASTPSRFLLDTSTAYILAPRKDYKTLMMSLFPQNDFEQSCGIDQSAGNLIVCDCAATLDAGTMQSAQMTLTIVLGGKEFTMGPQQLFKRVPTVNGRELCLLLIQQSPKMEIIVDPLALLAGLLAAGQAGGPGKGMANSAIPPFLVPDQPPQQPQTQRRLQQQQDHQQAPAQQGGTWWHGRKPKGVPEGAVPAQQVPIMVAPEGFDPMEDVWVLGGVFMESFAVILDFEKHRLGLALPSHAPVLGAVPAWTAQAHAGRAGSAGRAFGGGGGGGGGGLTLGTAFFWLLLVGGGGGAAYHFLKKTKRRTNTLPPQHDAEEHGQDQDDEDPQFALAE